eukprot:451222-Rhodomonas_salina.4
MAKAASPRDFERKRRPSAISWSAYMAVRCSAKVEDAQTVRRAASAPTLLKRTKSAVVPERKRKTRWGEFTMYVYGTVLVIFICTRVFGERPSAEHSEIAQSEGGGAPSHALTQHNTYAAASSSNLHDTFVKMLYFQVLFDFMVGM